MAYPILLVLKSLYAVTITEPFLQHYKSERFFIFGVLDFSRSKQMIKVSHFLESGPFAGDEENAMTTRMICVMITGMVLFLVSCQDDFSERGVWTYQVDREAYALFGL